MSTSSYTSLKDAFNANYDGKISIEQEVLNLVPLITLATRIILLNLVNALKQYYDVDGSDIAQYCYTKRPFTNFTFSIRCVVIT